MTLININSLVQNMTEVHSQVGGPANVQNMTEVHSQVGGPANVQDMTKVHSQVGGPANVQNMTEVHSQMGGPVNVKNMTKVPSQVGGPANENRKSRKPRIIIAASGSVAAIKFGILAHCLCEWAEVKAVATKSALHFIDKLSLPGDVKLYTDDDEWSSWKKIGDSVLHIELRQWADAMVIAPVSANTLAKMAGGLCDNLLTCIVRAWDFNKPLFVAPAMNTFMWNSPFTQRHLDVLKEMNVKFIPCLIKKLACGDYGDGAMAEPSQIDSTLRFSTNLSRNSS